MSYQTDAWQTWRYERQDGRYYGIAIEQDLLGGWLVRRYWGGIGRPVGQVRITPVADLHQARALVSDIDARRRQRNYQLKYLH